MTKRIGILTRFCERQFSVKCFLYNQLRGSGGTVPALGVKASPRVDEAPSALDVQTGPCHLFRVSVLPDGISKPPLDAPRQLVLPFGTDASVFARHLEIAVAGDLGCLDCTAADLLTPCDVGRRNECGPSPGKSHPSACAA